MRRIRIGLAACGAAAAVACDAGGQQAVRDAAAALPACEWCGAPDAPDSLSAQVRVAGAEEPGTRLVVTGVVYRPDGRTPAAGVLVYVYHTNAEGIYPRRGDETGNGARHGYLRGWLRTDARGRYRVETIRPAPYPSRREPAHVHLTVMPPGGDERYLPSILFADDSLLTAAQRDDLRRGRAPHILQPTRDADGVLHATHDPVLERWP